MYYIHNNNLITFEDLPHRIRLIDGTTRSDKTTFTQRELVSAGYIEVEEPPPYNENTQRRYWSNGTWYVENLSENEIEEKKQARWEIIRRDRDIKIKEIEWRIFRHLSELRIGIQPTESDISNIDNYIQQLRDITQQLDPFTISWPIEPN